MAGTSDTATSNSPSINKTLGFKLGTCIKVFTVVMKGLELARNFIVSVHLRHIFFLCKVALCRATRVVCNVEVTVTVGGVPINPLPTNDAPMRYDLCELSISLWGFM